MTEWATAYKEVLRQTSSFSDKSPPATDYSAAHAVADPYDQDWNTLWTLCGIEASSLKRRDHLRAGREEWPIQNETTQLCQKCSAEYRRLGGS
ncbi:hypothetical protein [Nocardia fluminea]|uniref:hypothetical protein n=1 Tax=Nocardia fluminea TaxID=134984 RepID=UPI0033F15DB0